MEFKLDTRWQWWMSKMPDDLEASAKTYGALIRPRKIYDAQSLLRLLVAYCTTNMSFRQTAYWSQASGLTGRIADTSLIERFERCEPWLQHLVTQLLPKTTLPEGKQLTIVDATHLRNAKGDVFRVHTRWSPEKGIEELLLTDDKTGESFKNFHPSHGEIFLGDRAFGRQSEIQAILEEGVDVICRLKSNAFKHGGKSLLDFADPCQPVHLTVAQGNVWILPKPKNAQEKSRKQSRRKAQKSQTPWTANQQKASDYLIIFTNLNNLDAASIYSIYRLRWQIELMFKRLKSLQRLEEIRLLSKQLCRVYLLVHLLIALVAEKVLAQTGQLFPPEVVQSTFSLAAVSMGFNDLASLPAQPNPLLGYPDQELAL